MSCESISIGLEVNPSDLRRINFDLDKICNDDDNPEWKLHFELKERDDAAKDFRSIVKLDVDINKEHHSLAEATAKHGLDEDQRGQADAAADVAKQLGKDSTQAKQAAVDVVAARSPESPTA
jgi:hypothetical protein